MKFQILDIALTLSIACLSVDAYAPSSLVSRTPTRTSSPAFVRRTISRSSSSNSKLFSSQWDEDDDDGDDEDAAAVVQKKSASYEEAGKGIADEDDKAAMDDMGDFDASGTVSQSVCLFIYSLVWLGWV